MWGHRGRRHRGPPRAQAGGLLGWARFFLPNFQSEALVSAPHDLLLAVRSLPPQLFRMGRKGTEGHLLGSSPRCAEQTCPVSLGQGVGGTCTASLLHQGCQGLSGDRLEEARFLPSGFRVEGPPL